MSMMESSFSESKKEPAFIREMRRISEGDRVREYTKAETRAQRDEFLTQYPAFRTADCEVRR